MATSKISALTQLSDIMQCSICLTTFNDPRMLPCIHTFCFQCLQDMVDKSNKKPGDDIQCPICRKEFTIPNEGIQGVQKNFFMTSLIEVRNTLNQSKMADLLCDICKANSESPTGKIPEAKNRCLVCQENLCESCCKMHKTFKVSKNHEILKIGCDVAEEDTVKSIPVINCDIHRRRVLDYYCVDCKKVVCILCFLESHRTHDFKDVNAVDEECRKIIKSSATLISTLAGELLEKKKKFEGKEDFVRKIGEREKEILQRSEELKEMIEEHTKSLLCSLGEIKKRHLKDIQTEEDELDSHLIILQSFSRYCAELSSKGSASDVCRSKDELLHRADELEEEHETYIMRPCVSFDVTFQATDLDNMFKTMNGNIIGNLKEHNECFEDFAVVIGLNGDVHSYKINLQRQSDRVSPTEYVPIEVMSIPAAAVYNNTMFVTGIGKATNEIWKYNFSSGWNRCGSLVYGRYYHCAEFIGEVLYIFGGRRIDKKKYIVMGSIEAYNATTKTSTIVGQLRFGSEWSTCVAYKDAVYLFGGIDEDSKLLNCVQVFNPAERTCTLLSTTIPRPIAYMRALSWETYAILLGSDTCFVFDFDGKTWEEKKQFKTDADTYSIGVILQNERIFVIDGLPVKDVTGYDSRSNIKADVKYTRASSILNDESAKWRTYCQLPKPISFIAVAKVSLVK